MNVQSVITRFNTRCEM